MILDGHIHVRAGCDDQGKAALIEGLRKAEVDGGVLISPPPPRYGRKRRICSTQERLENLLEWCEAGPQLYPFYWVDPTESDALQQVAVAVDAGVLGFKVIPSYFRPDEPRAMEVYREIARTGRPILFHSGILWDGTPSSERCRPVLFECLLEVEGLRFALAHVSWPWCDECLAVYGKVHHARQRHAELTAEMFVDVTPGTPPIYRREVLSRLFGVGYPVEKNAFFGTDGAADRYDPVWAREWIDRDRSILRDLGLSSEVEANFFYRNLMRFLGLEEPTVSE